MDSFEPRGGESAVTLPAVTRSQREGGEALSGGGSELRSAMAQILKHRV